MKAILIAQRDEMAGIAPGGTLAAATALPTLVVDEPEVEVVAPETVAALPEDPALPSFMSPAGSKGSLASACNQIGLTTTANGGLTSADAMQDANFALGEQFCLARSYAISRGDELTAQIAGFTPDQIAEQCAAFGPVLKDHVAALSLKPAADVLGGVEGFILSSGMSPAQLSGTAKVCLGVGYAKDDMNVAIGSALLLASLGERGYSEYLGHHLSQGFGAAERPDLAMDWYQMSLDAMEQGQMVVAPGVQGRDAVIKKASYRINGRASELEPEVEVQEAALPVFDVEVPETEVAEAEPVVEPVVEAAPEAVALAPVAEPGANSEIMQTGMQTAITAARLPLLIFQSN
jgi:hypothetical protein